ncbi:MAG TPA: thiamine phosphate synthase [Longimicrobiales bacterium]|nr:thiamine phosphate synthase [Longimicrobiales bacterium]
MSDPAPPGLPDVSAPSGRALPRLHAVTDDAVLAAEGWPGRAARVLEAGGPALALHVRGPRTGGAALHRLACALLPHARRSGAWLVVNDRVDVALAAGADGVQLGARSLPPAAARAVLGPGFGVGVSCHSLAEALAARDEGADWVFLGTVFETPTHPGRTGAGLEAVAEAASRLGGLPLLAIGGIDERRAAAARAAGAHGVAVVRGVWAAPDPEAAVRWYLEALQAQDSPRSEPSRRER